MEDNFQTLVVKAADLTSARYFVLGRGFKVLCVSRTDSKTQFTVSVKPDNERAAQWFIEPSGSEPRSNPTSSGYRDGTLLWYKAVDPKQENQIS